MHVVTASQPEAEGLAIRRLRAKTEQIGHLELRVDSKHPTQASQAEGREFEPRLPLQRQYLMVEAAPFGGLLPCLGLDHLLSEQTSFRCCMERTGGITVWDILFERRRVGDSLLGEPLQLVTPHS